MVSYRWGSQPIFVVKFKFNQDSIFFSQDQWVWGFENEDYDPSIGNAKYRFETEDTLKMGFRDDDEVDVRYQKGVGPLGSLFGRETPRTIDEVTFSSFKEAREAATEILLDTKEDLEVIKVAELINCHPSYREYQVLWYKELANEG